MDRRGFHCGTAELDRGWCPAGVQPRVTCPQETVRRRQQLPRHRILQEGSYGRRASRLSCSTPTAKMFRPPSALNVPRPHKSKTVAQSDGLTNSEHTILNALS